MFDKLPPWTNKTIQVRVKLTAKVSDRVNRALDNINQLARDPSLLATLLRQAVVETVLMQYRERFLARLPEAVAMERDATGAPRMRKSAAVLLRRARLRARLLAAQDQAPHKFKKDDVRDAQKEYSDELRLYRRTKKSLPSGRFRSLAFRVLRLVADASAIQTVKADIRGIRLGIGSKEALNAIETPSATPKLAGHATSSRQKILWRHLEFGTGIYRSKTQPLGSSRFRLPGGGWFFGGSPEYSLHLRGSRGVHALWDKQGRLYKTDGQTLQLRFRQLLTQALFR